MSAQPSHEASRAKPSDVDPLPATGAWRDGDPPGLRRFADLGELTLEGGATLPVRVAYETWGTLAPDGANAVLICHALTGDSHVTGDAAPGHRTTGWWSDMVGPGAPIDTNRYFVVAPNVLGGCQGTTGPALCAPDGQPWASRFPNITTRDQVAVEIRLAALLGISSWALITGPSMGGQRVLEWAIMGPAAGINVSAIAPMATSARASADQIAWAHPQLMAIRSDPYFARGHYYQAPDGHGPHRGLGIARQIAHTTYRTAEELEARFSHQPQHTEDPLLGGRFAVQSYLDHHGQKLARRFDANSYLHLTTTMMTHDLGRGRGGIEPALQSITAAALVVTIDTDRLFLPSECATLVHHIPRAEPLHVLHSPYGHDGFLIEFDQLGPVVEDFLTKNQI